MSAQDLLTYLIFSCQSVDGSANDSLLNLDFSSLTVSSLQSILY